MPYSVIRQARLAISPHPESGDVTVCACSRPPLPQPIFRHRSFADRAVPPSQLSNDWKVISCSASVVARRRPGSSVARVLLRTLRSKLGRSTEAQRFSTLHIPKTHSQLSAALLTMNRAERPHPPSQMLAANARPIRDRTHHTQCAATQRIVERCAEARLSAFNIHADAQIP